MVFNCLWTWLSCCSDSKTIIQSNNLIMHTPKKYKTVVPKSSHAWDINGCPRKWQASVAASKDFYLFIHVYFLDGVPIKNLNEKVAAKYRNEFLGFIFQHVLLFPSLAMFYYYWYTPFICMWSLFSTFFTMNNAAFWQEMSQKTLLSLSIIFSEWAFWRQMGFLGVQTKVLEFHRLIQVWKYKLFCK